MTKLILTFWYWNWKICWNYNNWDISAFLGQGEGHGHHLDILDFPHRGLPFSPKNPLSSTLSSFRNTYAATPLWPLLVKGLYVLLMEFSCRRCSWQAVPGEYRSGTVGKRSTGWIPRGSRIGVNGDMPTEGGQEIVQHHRHFSDRRWSIVCCR